MDGTGYRLGQGFGLYRGNSDDSNMHRNQYRHRKDQSETGGDCIRNQNRDGSCQ